MPVPSRLPRLLGISLLGAASLVSSTPVLAQPAATALRQVVGLVKGDHDQPLRRVSVKIMDADPEGTDEVMAEGTTNMFGQFAILYEAKAWDPPGSGEAPDIYVVAAGLETPRKLNVTESVWRVFVGHPNVAAYLQSLAAFARDWSGLEARWRRLVTAPDDATEIAARLQELRQALQEYRARQPKYAGVSHSVRAIDAHLANTLQSVQNDVDAMTTRPTESRFPFPGDLHIRGIVYNVRWSPATMGLASSQALGCIPELSATNKASCKCAAVASELKQCDPFYGPWGGGGG